MYMFKLYSLVPVTVFGLTGTFVLALIALNAARDYARALQTMRRIASGIRHEPFAISRTISRSREVDHGKTA
jgi:broad specificity phosphatase PhoE